MTSSMLRILSGVVALLHSTAIAGEPAFRNASLPLDERVNDLVSQMTAEEKVSQMMMTSPAIPRLGMPAYDWWNEGLHGLARAGEATVFPQAIGLAATWNPELHQRVAGVISTEARAKNRAIAELQGGDTRRYQGLTIWSPNINIFRDPRWGRGQETYGEDPFLTSRLAVAFIRGLQGDDPHFLKTAATVKHFAVHSGPESLRHGFDARISARDLRETYLPAFEAAIREGGAVSLMTAYNAVNGVPCSASTFLLDTVLRGEWGFTGAVVGDVDSVKDVHAGHHFTQDAAESSAAALKAGNDLCSGTTFTAIPDALKRGLIREADVDRSLSRLLKTRFQLGQFDPVSKVRWASISTAENNTPDHDALALEAAKQSLVLLKNDGTLPWKAGAIHTLAVLGPTADRMSALLGNYEGTPTAPVTLLDGLRRKLEPAGVTILHEPAVSLVAGFNDDAEPIRAEEMFTDETRATRGLRAEAFDNFELSGTPHAAFTDTLLDHVWNEWQPHPVFPLASGSIRWSGVLAPPVDGDYTFSMAVLGGLRIWVDERKVFDRWENKGELSERVTVRLSAAKAARFRIELAQRIPKGRLKLNWKRPNSDQRLERALAAARRADHIVLALGLTPELEGEEMKVNAAGFSGGDRTSILLPACQRELLEKVAALGKPVTVVLTGGSAVSFDVTKANSILHAWYYGQRGGDAVAAALLGEFSPGGQLPLTFYQADSDLPPFEDYPMNGTPGRTYRYFTGRPLFAFGHGLSYTKFEIGGIQLASAEVPATGTVRLQLNVANVGKMAGDEVVQVYFRRPGDDATRPHPALCGFRRVHVSAGQSAAVAIDLPAQQFRRWDEEKSAYTVAPGDYELLIGTASDAIVGRVNFRITPP
ncbi:glycoside hydrolase family 3 C-terminal domain-containing protein [bacterium]|nr:glycoside hydrolase family 3 C-terminal domain-containing protein [bacterium]